MAVVVVVFVVEVAVTVVAVTVVAAVLISVMEVVVTLVVVVMGMVHNTLVWTFTRFGVALVCVHYFALPNFAFRCFVLPDPPSNFATPPHTLDL
jgi:hypothetical protein